MRYTNKYNLPRALVELVTKDDYDFVGGERSISVTSLIDSPKIRRLKRLHGDEIVEDVSDMIWILFGKLTHKVFEKISAQNRMMEVRMKEEVEVDGQKWTVSGQPDLYDEETGILTDYKVTSVWSYVFANEKKGFGQQLNLYAYLLRGQGIKPRVIQNEFILRDWRLSEYRKSPETYPPIAYAVLRQTNWNDQQAEAFIFERLRAHEAALNADPDTLTCTDEERWMRAGDWAVYSFKKDGTRKERADRKFDTKEQAVSYAADYKVAHEIVERPGTDVRCSEYCSVRNWCHYAKMKGYATMDTTGGVQAEIEKKEE